MAVKPVSVQDMQRLHPVVPVSKCVDSCLGASSTCRSNLTGQDKGCGSVLKSLWSVWRFSPEPSAFHEVSLLHVVASTPLVVGSSEWCHTQAAQAPRACLLDPSRLMSSCALPSCAKGRTPSRDAVTVSLVSEMASEWHRKAHDPQRLPHRPLEVSQ